MGRIKVVGRDGGIRTRGLLLPKQARYQAALHPASTGALADAHLQSVVNVILLRDADQFADDDGVVFV